MKLPALLATLFIAASPMPAAPATPTGEIIVRDLGVPIKAVNWVRLHPGRGPDGKASLLASMGQNNGGLFVIDIDLATGHCRQFNAPPGRMQYPTASFRSPRTGALYIGEHLSGHLLRYDPARPERGLEDLGDGHRRRAPTGRTLGVGVVELPASCEGLGDRAGRAAGGDLGVVTAAPNAEVPVPSLASKSHPISSSRWRAQRSARTRPR